jgi:7-carboxy-7-deazaguanine synthase
MKINEIFYSIQGEGSLAGVPSAFIRLAGCPMRCNWCDTKFAWSADAGAEYPISQLLAQLAKFPAHHVVITGGEPFVSGQLGDMCRAIAEAGAHITIETAGTIFQKDLECDLLSISPKLSNSVPDDSKLADEHKKNCFNLNALQSLIDNYNYQLKFVIDTPDDLDDVALCLQKLKNIDPDKVYLMPQAANRKEYLEKSPLIVDICKRTGFPFSPRLHVMLYDNQKGK